MHDPRAWTYVAFLDLTPSVCLDSLDQTGDFVSCSPTILEGLTLEDTSLTHFFGWGKPVNDRTIFELDLLGVFHLSSPHKIVEGSTCS